MLSIDLAFWCSRSPHSQIMCTLPAFPSFLPSCKGFTIPSGGVAIWVVCFFVNLLLVCVLLLLLCHLGMFCRIFRWPSNTWSFYVWYVKMCAFAYMLPPSNASSIMAFIDKKIKLKTCAQICSVFGGMLIEHKNPWSMLKKMKHQRLTYCCFTFWNVMCCFFFLLNALLSRLLKTLNPKPLTNVFISF